MSPRVRKIAAVAAAAFMLSLLASCGGNRTKDSGPGGSASIPDMPGNAIPRPEARSRYGNGPNYEVLGKHYTVMQSGAGYSERGVASWYGKKFHGRLTSNRETYDMYLMTAAHKSLPLPTFVRVRNLRNNKSIVVRVNDRGPFVHNRIIDLSYAAALKLDMVRDGTSLVEVTAITFDEPAGDRPTRTVTAAPTQELPPNPAQRRLPQQDQEIPPNPAPQRPQQQDQEVPPKPAPQRPQQQVRETPPAPDPAPTVDKPKQVYAQVGAFGSRDNAKKRQQVLTQRGISNAFIHADTDVSPTLFRVRIGPILEVVQYDVLVEELENIGITDPYLIEE